MRYCNNKENETAEMIDEGLSKDGDNVSRILQEDRKEKNMSINRLVKTKERLLSEKEVIKKAGEVVTSNMYYENIKTDRIISGVKLKKYFEARIELIKILGEKNDLLVNYDIQSIDVSDCDEIDNFGINNKSEKMYSIENFEGLILEKIERLPTDLDYVVTLSLKEIESDTDKYNFKSAEELNKVLDTSVKKIKEQKKIIKTYFEEVSQKYSTFLLETFLKDRKCAGRERFLKDNIMYDKKTLGLVVERLVKEKVIHRHETSVKIIDVASLALYSDSNKSIREWENLIYGMRKIENIEVPKAFNVYVKYMLKDRHNGTSIYMAAKELGIEYKIIAKCAKILKETDHVVKEDSQIIIKNREGLLDYLRRNNIC